MTVREARGDDIPRLATRLRAADVREIRAATGEGGESALLRGLESSDPCYAIVDEADTPLALFGVVPDEDDDEEGLVWLLASEDLVRESVPFLRGCRDWIERLHARYRRLWNLVDARNEAHVRWLRWCGFEITETVESFGREGRRFHAFESSRGSRR